MSKVEEQHGAAEREWLQSWLRGPTKTRWTKFPPQVGDRAPDVELSDMSGKKRMLSEFWRGRPTLILFLRHFGCSCLAERWDKLKEELPEYEKEGVQVVAVCQGEPERTAEVARRRGYPFPILCDPGRKAYEIYVILEGTVPQVFHDFPWKPGDRETGEKMLNSRRHTERALVDNGWQLPAEFIVAKGGQIVLAYRYQYCEDFPPKTVMIGSIRATKQLNS